VIFFGYVTGLPVSGSLGGILCCPIESSPIAKGGNELNNANLYFSEYFSVSLRADSLKVYFF
jgi:hypothetical protein